MFFGTPYWWHIFCDLLTTIFFHYENKMYCLVEKRWADSHTYYLKLLWSKLCRRISTLLSSPWDNSIIEADNIAIENSEVAAEVIRYISDENGSAEIPGRFKSPAYWGFTLTSTDGNKRATWWKVGEHNSLTATIGNYQVDWIIG